jgi:hypothetical protein
LAANYAYETVGSGRRLTVVGIILPNVVVSLKVLLKLLLILDSLLAIDANSHRCSTSIQAGRRRVYLIGRGRRQRLARVVRDSVVCGRRRGRITGQVECLAVS